LINATKIANIAFNFLPNMSDIYTSTKPKTMSNNLKLVILVLFIALLAAGYVIWMFYNNYQKVTAQNENLSSQLENPDLAKKANEEKANEVLGKLGKILLVEESKDSNGSVIKPAVATIQDKDKVKTSNPEFYKYVENGDYLIIYPTRAIIYRENENKIMNIAPIITPQSSSAK
jgi:hypothetical protein